jgi:2-polyprenyl-6-hydroxyphenyl methylase/3-demethylubiquinone-9 3-methyltransferase
MDYYSEHLSGARLREVYEIAPPRARQYLEAEIRFVLERLSPACEVLELGCGYGRVALELARVARRVVGIDVSAESLALAARLALPGVHCEFLRMDAVDLRFAEASFDVVVCVQNGICAFGVDRLALVREAMRVTRPGGRVLLSSYAEAFWPHRLEWFEAQASRGLVGEIDRDRTGDGVIVCKDGFRAGTMTPAEFRDLCALLGSNPVITEVDGSSIFCEMAIPPSREG